MCLSKAPEWATASDWEEHGSFMWCFANQEHWRSYLETGELAKPKTLKDRARYAADPIAAERYKLSKSVAAARRGVRAAEKKIDAAQEALPDRSFLGEINRDKAVTALERAQVSLGLHRENLKRAEVDYALFTEAHPPRTSGTGKKKRNQTHEQ